MNKHLATAAFVVLCALPLSAHALTQADLLAQIAELTKLVQQLQAQLAALNPSTSSGQATPPTWCTNPPLFGLNTKGAHITELQRFLTSTGDYTYGELTGYYGPATRAAVERYQCRTMSICSGSPSDNGYGLAGPGTRRVMCTVVKSTPAPTPTPETYAWSIGAWSTCTNGQQARTVTCKDQNSTTVVDSYCTDTKPATSQSCGTTNASCTLDGITKANGQSHDFYDTNSVAYGQSCSTHKQTRTCSNGTFTGTTTYNRASCTVAAAQSCTFNGQTVAHGASVTAYQTATVSYGSSCVPEQRVCASGTLSGTYTYETCTPQAQTVPYLGDSDPVKGPWSSYYFFGRRTQSIVTNLSGIQIVDRRTEFDANGSGELHYCKKAADGTWPAICYSPSIEQRTIKRDCVGGNPFFWLKGYKDSNGNRFRLEVAKAIVEFDDGRVYDITNNNCNYDAEGLPDGIPYALFNIVDGYRMKVWFTQFDVHNKPTALNYWEQHYTRERVTNQCWQGSGPNTLWAIVQRQGAWQALFKDRYAENLEIKPGTWKLTGTSGGGGQTAVQTFSVRFGGSFTADAPTGVNTTLVWTSSNAMGKGMGWTSETEYGNTCTSQVTVF